ncbi:MAG: hypothetical protein H6Q14_1918, partial [Bacteroidetes bacterium]|nr:hypothetical protein [Bacteroidota bacterium]
RYLQSNGECGLTEFIGKKKKGKELSHFDLMHLR